MVALFPYTPNTKKDKYGTEALNSNNLICRGIKLIKKKFQKLELCVMLLWILILHMVTMG